MELIWALANHEPGKYHVTGFRPLKRPDFTHVISKKAAKQRQIRPIRRLDFLMEMDLDLSRGI